MTAQFSLLEAILANTPDHLYVFARDGRVLYTNPAGPVRFGFTVGEMLGRTLGELGLRPEALAAFEALRHEVLATGVAGTAENVLYTPEGARWYEYTLTPLVGLADAPGAVLCTVRDITRRHAVEEDLRRSTALLETVLEGTTDAVYVKDREGRYVMINPAGARLVGRTADEVRGLDDTALFDPDSARATRELDLRVLTTGEAMTYESEGTARGVRRVYFTAKAPVHDRAGRVVGLVGISRDITARHEAEDALRRAKEATDAANRELEAFSYSVAHDLRSPLASIVGLAQLLRELGDDPRARHEATDRIEETARRTFQLVDDLLRMASYARAPLRTERLDLSAMAKLVELELREANPGREVEVAIAPGLVAVGDRHLTRVVLENLLGNAWKFTARRAVAHVAIGRDAEGFFVRDDGAGFDPARAGELFKPFHRLHPASQFPGTGVGLATVARIVQRHGGRVWAEAVLGEGTTVRFTLPPG